MAGAIPGTTWYRRWPVAAPPKFNLVELQITFRCDLSCVGCNRACFIKPPHTPDMTVAKVAAFLEEAQIAGIRLREIRVLGGEETLHPDYQQIMSLVWSYARPRGCSVLIFSNQYSARAQEMVRWTRQAYPATHILGQPKQAGFTFAPATRFAFVDPVDAGVHCPWPCEFMGGRGGPCGSGVDQLGYTLCPVAGTIDTLLGLHARATSVLQMLDLDFVRWQAATICRHCGMYLGYKQLPAVKTYRGTTLSRSYQQALIRLRQQGMLGEA